MHTGPPRIAELFAGYGGLGLGVQAALGGQVVWYADACKFDKHGNAGHHTPHRAPCSILAHRLPGVPNIGDVTTADWSTVEPVDILTGGSPCQDLSHAGKRAGMTEGTRSNLWVAMREAIAQLRPTTVVWENVRGAYSAEATSDLVANPRLLADTRRRHGEPVLRALGRVLGDLSDLGYDCRWHGLRAADIGAPHGRFRVFVVATDTRGVRRGAGRATVPSEAPGGWAPADLAGRSDPPLMPTPQARDWKGYGPADGDRNDPNLSAIPLLLPTPAVNDMGEGKTVEHWDEWTAKMQAAHGNGNGHGKSLAIEAQRLLPTPRASDGEKGGPNQRGSSGDLMLPAAVQESRWGDYAAAIGRWEQVLGRPAPAPTMTSTKGNPQLSPVFVEWLMGLPAGWVTDVPGVTRNEALKALGNGVVPQQAEAALRTMLSWVPLD